MTGLAGLAGLLVLSEAGYLLLLHLNAVNGWEAVSTFWLIMGALFAIYAAASVLTNRCKELGKPAIWIIIFGAVLFRLTLLPAGIPYEFTPSKRIEAMSADLAGAEVTYDRFLLFDNDIWRYLWDGHVWTHGINPYAYPPNHETLDKLAGETSLVPDSTVDESSEETDLTGKNDPLNESFVEENSNPKIEDRSLTDDREIWRDIRENVNHADVPTIYPPLAQMVFRLSHMLAPGSLLMMKSLLVGMELIGIVFIMLTLRRLDLPVATVVLYAWNPLMIKVFAGSGHADSILMAALCATTFFMVHGWKSAAGAAFGFAILAKLSPIILLPFIARRVGWVRSLIIGAVVFAGYFPFLDAGQNLFAGLFKFAGEWQFNAGFFYLIQWIAGSFAADPSNLARQICAFVIVAIVLFLTWRDDLSEKAFVRSAAIAMGAVIILSPTVMPWYLSWVLPLAVLGRQYIWIYLSALVLAAFHVLIDIKEYAVVLWVEHGLFFLILVGQGWFNRTQSLSELRGVADA